MENYNVFKGIKQVFESTYTALTNSQKEGYLWFVRKDSATTVGDIYFGTKKYAEAVDVNDFVHKTGNETINGNKTFTGDVIIDNTNFNDIIGKFLTATGPDFSWIKFQYGKNYNTTYTLQQALDAKEDVANQTSAITSASTHNQYPTAKAVYDAIPDISTKANKSEAISALSLTMDSEYKLTLSGRTADGSGFTVSDVIDLPLETMVVSGAYDSANTQIVLTLKNGSTTSFPVSALVDGLQSEITSQNTLSADLISDGTTNKVVTGTDKTNWNNAYASAHTHTNKSALDNLTQTVIDNSHTHSNKTALDDITTGKTANWDNAYASAHTHDNKSVLDDISSNDIDKWDAAIQGVRLNGVDVTPDTGNVIDINIVEKKGYDEQYLTFTALQDTTFTFTTNALQYSLDDGATWTSLPANTASPTVAAGDKILWKQTGLTPSDEFGIGKFSATGNFEASGNIMSLYYGDDFVGQTDLTGKNYAFYKLFNGNNKLINTKNLILPAITLAQSCYWGMFYGCTSLTSAPTLPATTLAESCYRYMFRGCTSLTTTPTILPATTLAIQCYDNMFQSCTSLANAPKLPATTLTTGCYGAMFNGCTSLTSAPVLPATTLKNSCYSFMFQGCTSLTSAPELPATTLTNNCYEKMFSGCTNLNYIKCLATNISAVACTSEWVDGVAASGTFVKADNMTSWTTGVSGIPTNWVVYTESEYKEVKHYEISNLNVTHSFVKNIISSLKIWIDDFSKIGVQEMYDNYVNENSECKQYHLTQDTLAIDNVTYYIWEGNYEGIEYDYEPRRAYILTTTNDYDELLSQSLDEGLNNNFTSFGGFLNEDSEESYMDETDNKQYLLYVEQNNNNLSIYVDNISLLGLGDERTIEDYIDDPETYGCNPYQLTSETIDIDGETYYMWEIADDDIFSSVHYLLTTTDDYETLVNASVEANPNNLFVNPNSCIYAFMDEDNEIYETNKQNVIVKVE